MKKIKKILGVAVLALCFTLAAKADTQAAGKLTGIKQTDAGKSSINVSVDSVLGTDYYALELSSDNGANWTQVDKGTSANNLSDYSLSAGKSYYARVRGYSDYSCTQPVTEYSDEIEVVTSPDTSNMKVVQTGATTSGFTVKFSNVSGANTYFINCNDQTIGKSGNSTVKTSSKLSPASQYWVKAYAGRKSKSGFTAYEEYGYKYEQFKTLTNAVGRSSFGLSSEFYNIDTYYFSVNVSSACDGTQLQFATPAGKVKKTFSGNSSYRLEKFINGNFYKYRVRTYVNCGSKKAFSKWSSYRYIGVAKKVDSKINRKSYSSKYKTLSLNWSKVNGAAGYDVYISNKRNSGYKKVKSLGANKRSITITKYGKGALKKSTTYYVRIIPKAKVGKKIVKSELYHLITLY